MRLLATLAFVLIGCSRTPVEPGAVCGNCGTLTIPSPSDVQSALLLGYQQAAATCPGVSVNSFDAWPQPQVRYSACDFLIGGTCASGVTEAGLGYIEVSTATPTRTLPLITYEGKNWFFILGGCRDQAI